MRLFRCITRDIETIPISLLLKKDKGGCEHTEVVVGLGFWTDLITTKQIGRIKTLNENDVDDVVDVGISIAIRCTNCLKQGTMQISTNELIKALQLTLEKATKKGVWLHVAEYEQTYTPIKNGDIVDTFSPIFEDE